MGRCRGATFSRLPFLVRSNWLQKHWDAGLGQVADHKKGGVSWGIVVVQLSVGCHFLSDPINWLQKRWDASFGQVADHKKGGVS